MFAYFLGVCKDRWKGLKIMNWKFQWIVLQMYYSFWSFVLNFSDTRTPTPPITFLFDLSWRWKWYPGGAISAMAALVSFFFSQVSVTATTSSFLDVKNSVKGAVLHLIDRTFIVDILIFFASGPGLRLMSPESSRIIDNLSEWLVNLGMESNFLSEQMCKMDMCCDDNGDKYGEMWYVWGKTTAGLLAVVS